MATAELSGEQSPRRGRPPVISAEDIYRAVLTHKDSDWSVTTIAAELGVTNPAIYHYFPSKKAIVAAVGERLMLEQPVPAYAGDWRELLTAIARSWFDTFVKFPAFLDIEAATSFGDSQVKTQLTERALEEVLKAGFAAHDAAPVLAAMAAVSRECAAMAVFLGAQMTAPVLLDAERYPALASALPTVGVQSSDDYFLRALKVVLDGAGTYLPKKRR